MSKLEEAIEALRKDIKTPARMCKFIGGPWHGKEYLIPDKHVALNVPHKVDGKYKVALYIIEKNSNNFIYHYTE